MGLEPAGKVLLILGIVIAFLGLALIFADRIPFVGRLPGDISIKRDNISIHFPLVTFLILSIMLTVIMNVVAWFMRR
ncbi:MAG: DUF2905 domain-containing protein [Chloroflexi bacterium]|nr:DUF2905 domain-containing protein [Chloroflexota bacterium]